MDAFGQPAIRRRPATTGPAPPKKLKVNRVNKPKKVVSPAKQKQVVKKRVALRKANPQFARKVVTTPAAQRRAGGAPANTQGGAPKKRFVRNGGGGFQRQQGGNNNNFGAMQQMPGRQGGGARNWGGRQNFQGSGRQRPNFQTGGRQNFQAGGRGYEGNRGGGYQWMQPAEEAEPVDPETMIYPGKRKLFIGGVPQGYSEEQMRDLLRPYGGELQEIYLSNDKFFAIVTMQSREHAYRTMVALSGTQLEGKWLRVRPSPDAAVWVADLPPICSNELLKNAFSRFGQVLRAVVFTDTRGRSLGCGMVSFARKGSATACVETCQEQPFALARSPQPVRVEPYKYVEEDVGLPAKDMAGDHFYFKMLDEEMGAGPRMASKSDTIATEWLQLYQQQKLAKQSLKEKLLEERKNLLMKQREWGMEKNRQRQMEQQQLMFGGGGGGTYGMHPGEMNDTSAMGAPALTQEEQELHRRHREIEERLQRLRNKRPGPAGEGDLSLAGGEGRREMLRGGGNTMDDGYGVDYWGAGAGKGPSVVKRQMGSKREIILSSGRNW